MTTVLADIKECLGVENDDPTFDTDVLLHINSSKGVLVQLGASALAGSVTKATTWEELSATPELVGMVQEFVLLSTRLVFDPPGNSFVTNSLEELRTELTSRIVYHVEVNTV